MKKVTRYQCQFCKKDFKTPDRHYCKKNPELKNCFTCRHLKGWEESEHYQHIDTGLGIYSPRDPNYPDCAAGENDYEEWNIETIKSVNYNMQCEKWEQGIYDWSKGKSDEELEAVLW